MSQAADIFGTAFKQGTVTLLARVVGADGQPVQPAEISTAEYSIYLLDDADPDSRSPVDGHSGVVLVPSDVLFDTLQHDALWDVDEVGYNFRHEPQVSQYPAFAVAGRRYLVEYRLLPGAGEVIVVRFRIDVI